jgi:hypothetical protein
MPNDNRNLIVFALIAGLILLGYETFIVGPQARRIAAEQHTAQEIGRAHV